MVSANYIGNSTIHGQSATEQNPSIYIPGASCVINGRLLLPARRLEIRTSGAQLYLANPDKGQYFANMTQLGD